MKGCLHFQILSLSCHLQRKCQAMPPAPLKPQIARLRPPPPQYTDALGTPRLACHFHSLCDALQLRAHKPIRAGHYSSFTDPWSSGAPPTHNPASLPSPNQASSPSGPSPAQLYHPWAGTPGHSKNQAKKEMGRGEGLQAGSPERLLCNKGSSGELESP